MNYTEEQTKAMVDHYTNAEDKDEAVDYLAKELKKPRKSIIGKLAKEGVYVKKQYLTKQGTLPVTKKQMIHEFAILLDANPERLQGLEKTPKMDLEYLIDIVRAKLKL